MTPALNHEVTFANEADAVKQIDMAASEPSNVSGAASSKIFSRVSRVIRIVFKPLEWFLLGLIKFYKVAISPLLGPKCRFYPTCSTYGYEAISTHGPFKGLVLTCYRVGRCHPWQLGGIDPVPDEGRWRPSVNLDGSPRSLDLKSTSSVTNDSLEYHK